MSGVMLAGMLVVLGNAPDAPDAPGRTPTETPTETVPPVETEAPEAPPPEAAPEPASEAPTQPADPLTRARAHLRQLAYREALAATDEGLSLPNNARAHLLDLLEVRALAAAALEQSEVADPALRMLFTLSPDRPIPEQLSPRMRAPFELAQAWVREHGPLGFRALPDRGDGRVHVEVMNDRLGLARRVRFHFRTGAGEEEVLGGELEDDLTSSIPAPPSTTDGYRAELLGVHDAVLLEVGAPEARLALPEQHLVPRRQGLLPSLAQRWRSQPAPRPLVWGLVGGSAAALVTGSVFGARSHSAREQIESATRDGTGRITSLTQREAHELGARARREAVAANLFFTAGAALAVSGAAVWIWDGRVAAAPAPGGVVVSGTLP